MFGGTTIRPDERALLIGAGGVFALASASAAMTAATADAMFLSTIGPSHLGVAVAVSSVLSAVVLAVVGGLSDRLERSRVLATLTVGSAMIIGGLAGLALVAPRTTAVLALIAGKQLAAATDLALWVVIAERVDARRRQRVVPMLAAAGGAGAALGAVLVVPLAALLGAHGVLGCAAFALVASAVVARRLPSTRHVRPAPGAMAAWVVRSWRDGLRAVAQHALARRLALLVAVAGVFGSLAYFALGVELAATGGSTAELAATLGGVRAVGQVITLGIQIAVAPRLLTRLGTGPALLATPIIALASALGLVITPVLWAAIAMQISARVLDSAIESPAQKLTQTLLPTAVRGRVTGFLDGTAKRFGAATGGVLAAVLVATPVVLYGVTAAIAALWLWLASRIARELPSLAIEKVASSRDHDAAVDERAIGLLVRELSGPAPHRAADLIARLHHRGRVDVITPLIAAATSHRGPALWRAVIAVLDRPATHHGPGLLEAARAMPADQRELVIRAIGLAGGVASEAMEPWKSDPDLGIALAAEIASHRLSGSMSDGLPILGDAIRDGGALSRAAVDELCAELARGLATGALEMTMEAARHLVRALRRQRGELASRTSAFGLLGRVVEWASEPAMRWPERRDAELSLLRADLLELVRDRFERAGTTDDAPETAAALRMYGVLLEHTDAIEPDDLRRITRALGEPDDEIRAASEHALTALGAAAAGELIETAAWGRRRARDRAAALLAELPVTAGALDRLIDAELDALDATQLALATLTEPGDAMLARRLDERLREVAHTVLLLVSARQRSRAIARAAAAWRHARGGHERARALVVIETALPRALVGRLVNAVDEVTPRDRALAMAGAGTKLPPRDAVMRIELEGRDRLARALALHVLGSAGRSAHRTAITHAARAEALATNPLELLRRVTEAIGDSVSEGEPDMPTRVESLIVLGRVPLFAGLTTRQLADVAERVRWSQLREGSIVITAGDALDALLVIDDGELALGDRRFLKGDAVDELACVAPVALASDLRAIGAVRLLRLERVDFDELVDDVPGLAAAVCRALGERARKADDVGYRSPLISRS